MTHNVTVLRHREEQCLSCGATFRAALVEARPERYEHRCAVCQRLDEARRLYEEAAALVREAQEEMKP